MRIVINVFGVLLVLMGSVWFLQGVNVLPGSFMTGQLRWAVYGGIAFIIGAALLLKMGVRKIILNTIAMLLLFMGTVWFFQGINVLPGSFMSGQIKWAVYGGIADVLGVALLFANRRRTLPSQNI